MVFCRYFTPREKIHGDIYLETKMTKYIRTLYLEVSCHSSGGTHPRDPTSFSSQSGAEESLILSTSETVSLVHALWKRNVFMYYYNITLYYMYYVLLYYIMYYYNYVLFIIHIIIILCIIYKE